MLAQAIAAGAPTDKTWRVRHHTHDSLPVGQRAGDLLDRNSGGDRNDQGFRRDLAAERGGNCELTQAGKVIETPNGVKIAGPLNLAGTIAVNASSLFAKNLFAFLEIMLDKKEKKLAINWDDELVKGTLVAKDAKIVHPNLAQQS